MTTTIKSPKDFWAGMIYVAVGASALWLGQDYRFGTAGRMGPGYFPIVLASLLAGLGAISLLRSFVAKGEPIGKILWMPTILILFACSLFGYLLPRAGVVVALPALCLVSALASKEFRFDLRATAALLMFVTLCVLVFAKGLGVPLPITGAWLQPYVSTPWLR